MSGINLRIEPPTGPPVERDFEGEVLSFGRALEADVVISDASMSRRHACIRADGEAWLIEDLGARNGTFVNGERLEGRRRLAAGDVIQMGGTLVRVTPRSEARGEMGALGIGELGSSIFRSVADITGPEAISAVAPARAATRLRALNDFHRALAGPVALDALLEQLLEQLFAVLHPEEGVILLRQPNGAMTTAASRRLPNAAGELLVSRRLTDEVVEKGTAALVTDVAVDERFAGAHSMMASGIRSILAAPISDASGCLGMVAVYSRARVRRFNEDDLELLVSLASAAALRIRNIALAEEAAERRVHDRELALAHDIQMAMLPRRVPAPPEVDLAAMLIPARAVGGDLYDFLVVDRWLWFVVADAAGKGVSAALFMAMTRTLFRAIAHSEATVSSLMARMNAELARDNEAQLFVTAMIGRLDLRSGELAWCSAGHPLPIHVPASDAPRVLESAQGMALGILEEAEYAERTMTLAPGDLLVLFTDGVTDAINGTGELFAEDRLFDVIRTMAGEPGRGVVDAVVDAVTGFAGATPQEDDITVLAVRYQPR